jgi:hypothetical protein
MATISSFHDENLPHNKLSPLKNRGRKRNYSDTQPAATPRDCPDVGAPDKRRKENLASEQDWVDLGSTKQPGLPELPPENVGMPVTAAGACDEYSLESMTGPSASLMDLDSFYPGNIEPWNLFFEVPKASGPAVGENSSHNFGGLWDRRRDLSRAPDRTNHHHVPTTTSDDPPQHYSDSDSNREYQQQQ